LTPAIVRLLCRLLAVPFGGAVRVRRWLYKRGILPAHTLPARVISVGNVTIGGSGKTPLVVLLAGRYSQKRIAAAVLSRGYGRKSSQIHVLPDGGLSWRDVGDEPLMISRILPDVPVVVSGDRVAGGRLAEEKFHPRVIILDDGMQHLRLARDVDIAVIDAVSAFGNRRLFPSGPLREDLSALGRADVFFLARVGQTAQLDALTDFLKKINPRAHHVHGIYRPRNLRDIVTGSERPPESLKDLAVFAVSGIGNPASLEGTLGQLGAGLVGRMHFPDHYPYRPRDMEEISARARGSGAQVIVTTEKDAVRIPQMAPGDIPICSLGIEIELISGQKKLWELLEGGQ
jgi:tetraacyldisaccharide 4'-kinase